MQGVELAILCNNLRLSASCTSGLLCIGLGFRMACASEMACASTTCRWQAQGTCGRQSFIMNRSTWRRNSGTHTCPHTYSTQDTHTHTAPKWHSTQQHAESHKESLTESGEHYAKTTRHTISTQATLALEVALTVCWHLKGRNTHWHRGIAYQSSFVRLAAWSFLQAYNITY